MQKLGEQHVALQNKHFETAACFITSWNGNSTSIPAPPQPLTHIQWKRNVLAISKLTIGRAQAGV